ncbi:GNAT family N-acetyltransferase [Lysinibacillus sphaericus]|uniref:Ribosomal-protein-alanine N-acetyltransferase n=1 Tax=Lysinibacillus sphaericus OT4b.31 TaxID=1285586 RepID=R7Z8E3_LYSSH|nr:GNAT family protein [Lysinibacillus sphaericus]EON70294.1 ribosomal-protein-alanine N-acetyltransferase [Lysinibacillus sphaericus OT4b.31]
MNSTFTFTDFPRFQTERFFLRQATTNDASDIFALYSHEEVVKYLPFTPFKSQEDAINEINWYDKIFKEQTGLRWVIEDIDSKNIIGTCGFLNYEKAHNRIEIGYDLTPKYWGKGVMKETLPCIIHFAFMTMNINKIEAKVEPENTSSMRLLEKFDFYKEGVLRQHEFENGKYVDLAIFSKLKSEYK